MLCMFSKKILKKEKYQEIDWLIHFYICHIEI